MKKHIVILFMLLSIALTSCKYNDVFINPYDQNADTTEIQKICDRSEAECGYISEEYRNSIIELFCGECSDGLECRFNSCWDINECEDPTLNDCPQHSDCHNLDMKSDGKPYECICNENYSGDDCVPDSREQECTDLPANAEWNSVSSIDQTWNGSDWIPSTKGEYSEETSEIECHFKCKNNFEWNGSECEDKTEINDEDSVEDDDDDLPDGDTDTAPATPCDPNPCSSIENSTGVCSISDSDYLCGCDSGYFWNDGKCKRITLGNICTGQTRCYNESEEISCPTSETADFYGQDAQYAKAGYCYPQSFTLKTVSGNKVVVDNNTGLVWEQSPSSSEYIWENRATHCNELNSSNYCGINTWRVPTSLELLTIADSSGNPAVNTTVFTDMPTTDQSDFWASEQYGSDQGRRFGTYTGYSGYNSKTSTYKVLCVSGDEMPKGVFTSQTISGKVVVTDSTTGLMWQKEYVSGKTWQQALKYCEDSTYAGYSDWRMPNKNELASLLNLDKSESPLSNFPDMPSKYFWSSSTRVGSTTSNAWNVIFNDGRVSNYGKTDTTQLVRCVRSEKINDPCESHICGSMAHSSGVCVPENAFEYSCACDEGYFWNGTNCAIQLTPGSLTLGNICTGQTKCYNASSSITCPTSASADFYGQDAQFTSKCTAQSFTASSNVVVDNNTGLTWEKSPSTDTYTWANRNTHCNELNSSNYGGRSNWRVPNPLEFLSIVDNSKYNLATNSNFTNMPTRLSDFLWTSKEYDDDTSLARAFNPYYGYYSYGKSKTTAYYVICVSGDELVPATSSDFVTSSDGKIVTDNRIGLMWQKEYITGKTWQQALAYCQSLNTEGYGGYSSGWRLPNRNELASLLDPGKSSAPYSNFPDMPSTYFWSSSTRVEGSTSYTAWGVYFNYGSVSDYNKPNSNYVRCVR